MHICIIIIIHNNYFIVYCSVQLFWSLWWFNISSYYTRQWQQIFNCRSCWMDTDWNVRIRINHEDTYTHTHTLPLSLTCSLSLSLPLSLSFFTLFLFVSLSFSLHYSFFGILALYLVIGATIQAIRGKKGRELIPNHDFWGAVFLYIVVSLESLPSLLFLLSLPLSYDSHSTVLTILFGISNLSLHVEIMDSTVVYCMYPFIIAYKE